MGGALLPFVFTFEADQSKVPEGLALPSARKFESYPQYCIALIEERNYSQTPYLGRAACLGGLNSERVLLNL